MDADEYAAGVAKAYQDEVMGEGMTCGFLAWCPDDLKTVMATLLQLESEAKVRLRPLVHRMGLPLAEDERGRQIGREYAEGWRDIPWGEAALKLAELAKPYLERFKQLEAAAPDGDKPFLSYMVAHEQAIIDYCELEAAGQRQAGLDRLVSVLEHPLRGLPG